MGIKCFTSGKALEGLQSSNSGFLNNLDVQHSPPIDACTPHFASVNGMDNSPVVAPEVAL